MGEIFMGVFGEIVCSACADPMQDYNSLHVAVMLGPPRYR